MLSNIIKFIVVNLFCFFSLGAGAELNIVVSIKPLYSLVQNVSGTKNHLDLLINNAASPHLYQLRPSDIKKIENADIIFLINDKFETFLSKYLSEHKLKAKLVRITDWDGIKYLTVRTKQDILEGNYKAHCGCKHGHKDLHFWTDIDNAKEILLQIQSVLVELDPANREYYQTNVYNTDLKLAKLDNELKTQLSPIKDKKFIVFHDAYQYFEKRYNLSNVGTISAGPNMSYGAKTIDQIQTSIKNKNIRCIFAEPQFASDVVNKIAAIGGIKSNYLDVEGGISTKGIKPEDYYFVMMKTNGDNLVECLS